MATPRKPASDRGRAAIDWQQAFHYYAALPPAERDYGRVAVEFRVSVRTVERHGLEGKWRDRAQAIDAAAAAAEATELAKEKTRKLTDADKLIDAFFINIALALRENKMPLSGADIPRLHKVRLELWDRLDAAATALPPAPPTPSSESEQLTHKLDVLRALREAGVLERLLDDDEGERSV